MNPDQIIGTIIATVVGGVLVYWLTVGLSGRRTRATQTATEAAGGATIATSATLSTTKAVKALAAMPEPTAQTPDKSLLEQFEAAKQMSDGTVKDALLLKLAALFMDRHDIEHSFKAAENVKMYGARDLFFFKLVDYCIAQNKNHEAHRSAIIISDSSKRNTSLMKVIDAFVEGKDLTSAASSSSFLVKWDSKPHLQSFTSFPDYHGQDYAGKVKVARAMHDAGRYVEAAQLIETIYPNWKEKAKREVFGS